MTRQATNASTSTTPTRFARFAGATTAVWQDIRHAQRRLIELQTGDLRRR